MGLSLWAWGLGFVFCERLLGEVRLHEVWVWGVGSCVEGLGFGIWSLRFCDSCQGQAFALEFGSVGLNGVEYPANECDREGVRE